MFLHANLVTDACVLITEPRSEPFRLASPAWVRSWSTCKSEASDKRCSRHNVALCRGYACELSPPPIGCVKARAHDTTDEEAEEDSRPTRDQKEFLHAVRIVRGVAQSADGSRSEKTSLAQPS